MICRWSDPRDFDKQGVLIGFRCQARLACTHGCVKKAGNDVLLLTQFRHGYTFHATDQSPGQLQTSAHLVSGAQRLPFGSQVIGPPDR